ncbi:hypothetical protein [Massilia sp. TS11]|nr:hypothetical protein [Massilia sp. TS11]
MRFLITITTTNGSRTYPAIGSRDSLMDAAYDDGALGVTVRPL